LFRVDFEVGFVGGTEQHTRAMYGLAPIQRVILFVACGRV